MKMTRRILAWALAMAMLITCGITGLVLPASADTAPVDYLNGQGTFEDGTTPQSTILSDMFAKTGTYAIVDNPKGEGKVLQLGKFVDEDGDGVNDVAYTHDSYPKWGRLYNAETGTYNKVMEVAKSYTFSFDLYGDAIAFYLQGNLYATSHNAEDVTNPKKDNYSGWFELSGGKDGWKTYTFTLVATADIAEVYHKQWYNWGSNFVKSTSNQYGGAVGYTYIDNMTLTETQASSVSLDKESAVLEIGDKTEAPVATFAPAFSAHEDVVYSTNNEAVATVDATTGEITAVAIGKATITATAGGLTDTIEVTVQKDRTEVYASMSNFVYDATYTGADAGDWVKGNKLAVKEGGYVTIPTHSTFSIDRHVRSSYLPAIEQDDWMAISFDARISEAAEGDTGTVTLYLKFQGMTTGYTYENMTVRASAGDQWVRYTVYVHARGNQTYPYIHFSIKADGTTTKKGVDIANLRSYLPKDGEMDISSDGSFDTAIPYSIGGLSSQASGEIVTDPKDPNNKVYKYNKASVGAYVIPTQQIWFNSSRERVYGRLKSNTMYKLTFRMIGKMHVATGATKYGNFIKTEGSPSTACTEWKTVTAYYLTSESTSADYAMYIRGETAGTMIDDLQVYEIGNATGFEFDIEDEMVIGESQKVTYTTIPKHAYPGATVTLSVAGQGFSLSGSTLSLKSVAGVTLTTGTVTATSDLLDEQGNPVASSFTVKALYPKEHFIDGSMDTTVEGLSAGGVSHVEFGVEGIGVDGSKGMKMTVNDYMYFKNSAITVRPNSLYCFSVKARSDGTGATLQLITTSNNTGTNNVGSATTSITNEWKTYQIYLATGPTTTSLDTNWTLGLHPRALGKVDGVAVPTYFDDLSFELIAEKDFIMMGSKHQDTTITMSKDGQNWSSLVLTDVTPGTVVKVKTWHHSSMIQQPGAYNFTANDGSVTKILSPDVKAGYTEAKFGKHGCDVQEFIMPEVNNGLLNALCTKTANLNADFAMDTVATSLRYTDEEGTYDGIRFLTRVAFDKNFDPEAESYSVTYQGQTYTILEIGSLLKRYEEAEGVEVELTRENAKWKAVAYDAAEGTMRLLDYTTQKTNGNATNYIDFASVMTKGDSISQESFDARQYTARGYMLLDADADGVYTEGTDIVVYSKNQVTDSVNSVKVRL